MPLPNGCSCDCHPLNARYVARLEAELEIAAAAATESIKAIEALQLEIVALRAN